MKNKKITVIFRAPALEKAYRNLSNDDILKKRIDRTIEQVKQEPFKIGQPISKDIIPKEYLRDGFDNAFWVDLSKEWRLIYSLRGLNKIEILCIILDWFDSHKKYERKFKYS